MHGQSLFDFPIHLGLGASAVAEPQFTGMDWYDAIRERHGDDLDEGRLVASIGSRNHGRAGRCIRLATKSCAASRAT